MIKIRSNTFESNSSSVHTIAIDTSGLEPSYLPINKKTNKVIGTFGVFGKDLQIYSSQIDKLAYLLTNLYYLNHCSYEDIEDLYEFKYIEDAICEYCGCDGLEIDFSIEPELDHQSVPDFDIPILEALDYENPVINFIFNKYISLKTCCD